MLSYGITDEIFAVAASQPFLITPEYMAGLISVSTVGWCLGTALGAVSGSLMPEVITNAMGILFIRNVFGNNNTCSPQGA